MAKKYAQRPVTRRNAAELNFQTIGSEAAPAAGFPTQNQFVPDANSHSIIMFIFTGVYEKILLFPH
ncbi:MAG: hypothetical protein Q8Q81_08110 [Oxalobacteraceae bacterium]|nr:hypothetical protein [Oxalobacteraceae bacterium]